MYCVHPKNPIILANLGEPIPTTAIFKGASPKSMSHAATGEGGSS